MGVAESLVVGLGIWGIICGILVIGAAYMVYSKPASHSIYGIVIVIFSVLSSIESGGYILGLILGIIGGLWAIVWKSKPGEIPKTEVKPVEKPPEKPAVLFLSPFFNISGSHYHGNRVQSAFSTAYFINQAEYLYQISMTDAERPTIAFIFSLIGGVLILLDGLVIFLVGFSGYVLRLHEFLGIRPIVTAIGIWGIICGLIVLASSIILNNQPEKHTTWGVLILVFSLICFLSGGGFVIGGILGIIGGILALVWAPSAPKTPPAVPAPQ